MDGCVGCLWVRKYSEPRNKLDKLPQEKLAMKPNYPTNYPKYCSSTNWQMICPIIM